MASPEYDVERGPEISAAHPSYLQPEAPVESRHPSVANAREITSSHLLSPRNGPASTYQQGQSPHQNHPILSAFRYHVGIHTDPSLLIEPSPVQQQAQDGSRPKSTLTSMLSFSTNGTFTSNPLSRPAPNVGIYHRVVASEQRYHREYQVFSILINGALGLQIIFAAALTALGAGNGPHSAVTAFGALNTVLAGLLTFLKGSGLPNRLKYYENEWRKVREYIEQRERDFASEAYAKSAIVSQEELLHEITTIEHMYEAVRKDVEANTPDSYVSMSNAMRSGPTTAPPPSLAKNLMGLKDRLSGLSHGLSGHARDETRRMGRDVNDHLRSEMDIHSRRITSGLSNLEKGAHDNIHEVVDDVHGRARDIEKQAENRIRDSQRMAEDGIRSTQRNAEMSLHGVEEGATRRVRDVEDTTAARLKEAELKIKEMEDKVVLAAEKAAEKVLQMTRSMHHDQTEKKPL